MVVEVHEKLYQIIDKSPRYPLAAYTAIHKGLDFTMQLKNVVGHVNGQELALGMAGYMKIEYGPYAAIVLENWGIRTTLDFGRIVFNMVEAGLMRKTEEDTLEDFVGVYRFDEVFGGEVDWLRDIRAELGLPVPNADSSV